MFHIVKIKLTCQLVCLFISLVALFRSTQILEVAIICIGSMPWFYTI